MLSRVFVEEGEYIKQPLDKAYDNWDIMNDTDFAELVRICEEEKPELVTLAFPCTVWSSIQNLNLHIPGYQGRLSKARRKQVRLLERVRHICDIQRQHNRLFLLENPIASEAFRQRPIAELLAVSDPHCSDVFTGITDQCVFNLRHYRTNKLLKKPTRFVSNSPEVINALAHRCNGCHEHGEIVGGGDSSWSGRWTKPMCQAI